MIIFFFMLLIFTISIVVYKKWSLVTNENFEDTDMSFSDIPENQEIIVTIYSDVNKQASLEVFVAENKTACKNKIIEWFNKSQGIVIDTYIVECSMYENTGAVKIILNDTLLNLYVLVTEEVIVEEEEGFTTKSNLPTRLQPTSKPITTTTKPTTKPITTTSKPINTTSKPTTKPINTTSKPINTTSKPIATTSKPINTTSKPNTTTSKKLVSAITEPILKMVNTIITKHNQSKKENFTSPTPIMDYIVSNPFFEQPVSSSIGGWETWNETIPTKYMKVT